MQRLLGFSWARLNMGLNLTVPIISSAAVSASQFVLLRAREPPNSRRFHCFLERTRLRPKGVLKESLLRFGEVFLIGA